jgi:DNA end-binding protein Ku
VPGGRTAIWSGSLSFGLVAVPVAILTAVRPKPGTFHLLHEKDAARLKRRLFCPSDQQFVSADAVVRGFEVEEGQHVIVEDEEIRSLAPRRSRTIEIQEFVDLDRIHPAYYDRPYYLVPTGPEKPYRLLVEVLGELHKAGIAQFVMNEREKFCCLQSIEGTLCLLLLRFPEELRSADELIPDAEPRTDDVDAMVKTIKRMDWKFDPNELTDEYEERVQKLIKRKRKRHEIVEAPEVEEEEGPEAASGEGGEMEIDLVSALEESLAREREHHRRR